MSFHSINPAELGEHRGWNNGMLAPAGGRILFVAGQTARDETGRIAVEGFVEQFTRALERVLTVVRAAGGAAQDIGRLTLYVTDLPAYLSSRKELGEAYRALMGHHYPAMALVEVNGLADENALLEIEATAVLP